MKLRIIESFILRLICLPISLVYHLLMFFVSVLDSCWWTIGLGHDPYRLSPFVNRLSRIYDTCLQAVLNVRSRLYGKVFR